MITEEIEQHLYVQNIALKVLHDIQPFIQVGISEKEIAQQCVQLFKHLGIKDCWYHGVPALVLAGERSILSMSGREYKPNDGAIRLGDLVTIDLSPQLNGYWGDCARSYTMQNASLEEGIRAQKKLHAIMRGIVTPTMTMHAVYTVMNAEIKSMGYENLDFAGNLGHSIEKEINKRRYIEADNATPLGDVMLFTFEPHIRKQGITHGFKRENIYYFEAGKPMPLGDLKLLEII